MGTLFAFCSIFYKLKFTINLWLRLGEYPESIVATMINALSRINNLDMYRDDFIKKYFFQLGELTQICGPAFELTDEELVDYLQQINGTQIKGRTFHLALNLKDARFLSFGKDLTVPGLKDALGHEENIDFDYYLKEIIPEEILVVYLESGLKTYEEVLTKLTDIIKIKDHSYTTYFPIKHINKKLYFVSQKCVPIQIDSKGCLITHINTYEIHFPVGEDKLNFKIKGFELKQEFLPQITAEAIEHYEKYTYELIKNGINGLVSDRGKKIGPRVWRCLYEYLYLTNTGKKVTSAIVLANIIDDPQTPEEIKKDYQNSQGDFIRRELMKVRDWLNHYFCIPEGDKLGNWEDTITFLCQNAHFRAITNPYTNQSPNS